MNEKQNPVIRKYFAAANSFNGFISFFDQIFNSELYERIYVLKGGPGTGKSSFMKRVSSELSKEGCDVEEIYCSSDPQSLDGVIAKSKENKIAVLDGTAPHERDAIIPGAIDEIINLGDGWDCRWLIAKKDKILSLIKEKSNAYKSAYSYLKIAGTAEEYITSIYNKVFDEIETKNKAEKILSSILPQSKQNILPRLTSSFGKYGHYKINDINYKINENISIYGDEFASLLFLKKLQNFACSKGLSYVELKYPLNPSFSEGLCFDNLQIVIYKGDIGEINSKDYLKDDKMYLERTRVAKETRKFALFEAERWFSVAAEIHFELENLYGQAMDFDKNNKILDIKLREMKNILQI